MKSWPRYQSLLETPYQADPDGRNYRSGSADQFFTLSHADLDIGRATGWKIHLSVDPQDTGRAWDLITDRLISHGVPQARVVNPTANHIFGIAEHEHAGKMITLYDCGTPVRWEELLQSIENAWAANGIRPGHEVKGDRKVPGGNYVYYRNDRARSGAYLRPDDFNRVGAGPRHNPASLDDPFAQMRLVPALPNIGWLQRNDEQGRSLLDLPVATMPEHAVEMLMGALRYHHFHPSLRISSTYGVVMYLAGPDAERYQLERNALYGKQPPTPERQIAEAEVLPPAERPAPRSWVHEVRTRAGRDFQELNRAGEWVPQVAEGNTPVLSLKIDGLPERQVQKLDVLLRDNGYSPQYRQSASQGGQVVYVLGNDARDLYSQLEKNRLDRGIA